MMQWRQLFSSRRLGIRSKSHVTPLAEGRSQYQRDFDRVIFSPAFRHLQSKTQVVPLPENDFVHTRLTHSLEASCVGRSLGRIIGDRVVKSNEHLFEEIGVTSADFEAVVASASLAHDIGNPPFGHSGEDAIADYFRSDAAVKHIDALSPAQIADLQNFEGNAAGFHLLTYTAPTHSEVRMGMGLTFATLGTFTKYPKGALPDLKNSGKASQKKFGFFQSEREVFAEVAGELGLIAAGEDVCCRHPLAFLVEAADDICYSIIDFEDGYKLGRLEFDTVEQLFRDVISDDFKRFDWRYKQIMDRKEKIGFLQAIAINTLVKQSADVFSEHLSEIMNGSFDQHLTDLVPAKATLNEISAISVAKLYQAEPVVEIEVAGFEVLGGLLDVYLSAIGEAESARHDMVRNLIPDRYLDAGRRRFTDRYLGILNIALFVASMTDTRAIELFRKFKGISL